MSEVVSDAELGKWMSEVAKVLQSKRPGDLPQLDVDRCRAAFEAGWTPEQFANQPALGKGQVPKRLRDEPDLNAFVYTASACALLFIVLNWLLPAYLQNKVAGGLRVDDVNSWTVTLSNISIWFREHKPMVGIPVAVVLAIWLVSLLVARAKAR